MRRVAAYLPPAGGGLLACRMGGARRRRQHRRRCYQLCCPVAPLLQQPMAGPRHPLWQPAAVWACLMAMMPLRGAWRRA